MPSDSHETIVARQYAPRADAYVASAVHATGADLELMAEAVGHRPDAVALDLGCGGGHVAFRLAPLVGRLVAHDLTPDMLRVVAAEAGRRGLAGIETRQGAAESLPDPDGRFDVVATRFSAHHWRNLQAGLAEMRRVLKPGGLLLVADTVAPEDPLADTWLQAIELLRDPSHGRNRSVSEWVGLLARAGFAVQALHRDRLRLQFADWVARMATPELQVAAIRALQQVAGAEVRRQLALEPDGSFTIATALFVARRDDDQDVNP